MTGRVRRLQERRCRSALSVDAPLAQRSLSVRFVCAQVNPALREQALEQYNKEFRA